MPVAGEGAPRLERSLAQDQPRVRDRGAALVGLACDTRRWVRAAAGRPDAPRERMVNHVCHPAFVVDAHTCLCLKFRCCECGFEGDQDRYPFHSQLNRHFLAEVTHPLCPPAAGGDTCRGRLLDEMTGEAAALGLYEATAEPRVTR